MIKALSLFSCIGVSEFYLKDIGVEVVAASDIDKKRCSVHNFLHPNTAMVCGDIRRADVKEDILKARYADKYTIEPVVANVKDYGVPQSRPRAIIKMYKSSYEWEMPLKEKEITLREAIGHLSSLESGETSGIIYRKSQQLCGKTLRDRQKLKQETGNRKQETVGRARTLRYAAINVRKR